MKIVLIRHQKVCMEWKKRYDSSGYDKACRLYDISPIFSESISVRSHDFDVYISELSRTHDTAEALFGDIGFRKTALLNEVPIVSFKDTGKSYPTWFWNAAGRIQWFFNSRRQPEGRYDTEKRALDTIDFLEGKSKSECSVTYGFYMLTLIRKLKKCGYRIEKRRAVGFKNMEMVTAVK